MHVLLLCFHMSRKSLTGAVITCVGSSRSCVLLWALLWAFVMGKKAGPVVTRAVDKMAVSRRLGFLAPVYICVKEGW